MTKPLTHRQLDDLKRLAADYLQGHTHFSKLCGPACTMATGVPALVAELDRLHDELAVEKALHDPRLRGLLVKTAKDRDQYVSWSTVTDGPKGVFSRETAVEYGYPRTYLDRADTTGTSALSGEGSWDDAGFVADQRGWLKRDLIGDYAIEYLLGDRIAAYALLEPIDDDTEATESRTAVRDCSTCEHHLPATPAEEQCNPDGCGCTGYPEACDVRANPAGAVFPISNCPSWQARVTESD